MDRDFLERLDRARGISITPYKITSGYRCPTYNLTIGGKSYSSHIYGKAADIEVSSSPVRFYVVEGLIRAGFNRIGIGKNFVHVDSDESKPDNVIWTYYN